MFTLSSPNKPLYLRSLELSDLDRIYKWHNSEDLYTNLTSSYHPVSRLSVEQWLTKRVAYSIDELNLAICAQNPESHIGNIYLRSIDLVSRNAELAMFIADMSQRGHGYGQESVRMLLSYAFNVLGLIRVYLYVLANNTVAAHVYENCGFIIEGTLRKHVFKNGQFEDLIVMGICASND